MIDPETLLAAVSDENPCGEDIAYDPKFIELQTLIAGKPETQFSAAEEPDWRAVREACLALLARSKHLRVATLLCPALVKLDGAPGLRDGLKLLKGLLEMYWADLYPKLDPADDSDPTERINIISSLSSPIGTFGDPLRFLERLREMPLADAPQLGPISAADLIARATGQGGDAAISPAQAGSALREVPPTELAATFQAITESSAMVGAIDDFLTQSVGADRAPDLSALSGLLGEIEKSLAPFTAAGVQGSGDVSDESGGAAGGEGGSGGGGSGAVASRRDVISALDRICEYYARHESSSPVPLLLKRARRLVDMDFVQIVNELAPDAIAQINVVTGVRGQSTSDAAASSEEPSA